MSEGQKIKDAWYKNEVDALLDGGMSPEAIKDFMEFQYGEKVSMATLYRYKNELYKSGEKRVEAVKKLLKKTGGTWIDIAAIRIGLVITHLERMQSALDKETQIGIPLKPTGDVMEQLNVILNDLKKDYQDMGLMQVCKERVVMEGKINGVIGNISVDTVLDNIPQKDKKKIALEMGKELIARLRANSDKESSSNGETGRPGAGK